CFLNAPDMYMEKLIVGPGAKGTIELNLPLADNVRNVAAALGKPVSERTVTMMAKPSHEAVKAERQESGVRGSRWTEWHGGGSKRRRGGGRGGGGRGGGGGG
ncbi:fructose-bisphosphatase class II, partial [Escherichia coli]|uniref:fructose-bisphosphatase class II n=1 Tax=Escherichia coli TaxID=562 RepID=UPI0010CB4BD3